MNGVEMKYFAEKILILLFVLASGAVFAADIMTVDGKEYKDVLFDRVDEKGLHFRHSAGHVTLVPEKLSHQDRQLYAAQISNYNSLPEVRIKKIEAFLDSKLKVIEEKEKKEKAKKDSFAYCAKLYATNDPNAFKLMQEAISKYAGTPDAENGKKLLAEWKKKKQSEVWLHHPGNSGGEYRIYVFNYSADLESVLKSVADLHWQVNSSNDQYTRAFQAAQAARQVHDLERAKKALELAEMILQESKESRENANKITEKLITQAIYNTTIRGRGMRLQEVKAEYIFFIVETTDRGKYLKVWCHRAKGGDDLYINGREIKLVNML